MSEKGSGESESEGRESRWGFLCEESRVGGGYVESAGFGFGH